MAKAYTNKLIFASLHLQFILHSSHFTLRFQSATLAIENRPQVLYNQGV